MSTLPITPITIDPIEAGVAINILKRDYHSAAINRLRALRAGDDRQHEFHVGECMALASALGCFGQSLPEVPTYLEFIANNS